MLLPNVAVTAAAVSWFFTHGVGDSRVDSPDGRQLLDTSTACKNQVPEPLLWSATSQGRTVYLVASYNLPDGDVAKYAQVTEALSCADAAYFELACPLTSAGIGNYMAHCHYYSTAEPSQDTIEKRLGPTDYQALNAAVTKLWQQAPAECAALAGQLQGLTAALNGQTEKSRLTLLSLYHSVLRVLNPKECQRQAGELTYEDDLRSTFGKSKPIFGLRDPETECNVYAGNSVEEDQALAKKMIQNMANEAWIANVTAAQAAIVNTMQCGDLTSLQTVDVSVLPYMGERIFGQSNADIVNGISVAFDTPAGTQVSKYLVAVVGVTHFVDRDGVKSVQTLLQEKGFAIERLTTANKLLGCQQSEYNATGAEQLGQCLIAPGKMQNPSCQKFNKEFIKLRGEDELYGRTKKEPEECIQCQSSPESCECTIVWTNSTGFRELCERTNVDGVHGEVLYMDLIRDPGSTLQGNASAEHTVKHLFQMCYATTCDKGLAEDTSLREWYQRAGGPQTGKVVLRPAFSSSHDLSSMTGGLGGSSWVWITLACGLCLAGTLIAILIKLFLGKKKRQKRGARLDETPSPSTQLTADNPETYAPVAPPKDGYQSMEPMENRGIAQDGLYGEPKVGPPATPGHYEQDPYGSRDSAFPQHAFPQNSFLQYGQEQQPMQPKIYDNSLLSQASLMQQQLADAGSAAVQQMQMNSMAGLGTQQGWQMQTMQQQSMTPPLSPSGLGAPPMPFQQNPYSPYQQQAPPVTYSPPAGLFDSLDRNQDGVITRAEFMQAFSPSTMAPSGFSAPTSFTGQQQTFPMQQPQQSFFGAAPQQQAPALFSPIAPGGMQQMGGMQGGWQQGMFR